VIPCGRLGAALVALIAVTTCANTQEVRPLPSMRIVESPPGTAKVHLVERLVELGFTVTGRDTIQARKAAADPSWAECGRVLVEDPTTDFSRKNWADPRERSTIVEAWARSSPEGTLVHLVARHAASYRNIYTNLPLMRPCATTGVLEALLLDAAG
jgi:hypothetical protein